MKRKYKILIIILVLTIIFTISTVIGIVILNNYKAKEVVSEDDSIITNYEDTPKIETEELKNEDTTEIEKNTEVPEPNISNKNESQTSSQNTLTSSNINNVSNTNSSNNPSSTKVTSNSNTKSDNVSTSSNSNAQSNNGNATSSDSTNNSESKTKQKTEPKNKEPVEKWEHNSTLEKTLAGIIKESKTQVTINTGKSGIISYAQYFTANKDGNVQGTIKNRLTGILPYVGDTIQVYARDYYKNGNYVWTEFYII